MNSHASNDDAEHDDEEGGGTSDRTRVNATEGSLGSALYPRAKVGVLRSRMSLGFAIPLSKKKRSKAGVLVVAAASFVWAPLVLLLARTANAQATAVTHVGGGDLSSSSSTTGQPDPASGSSPSSSSLLYTAFDDMSWAINERVVSTGLGPRQRELYREFLSDCARLAGPRHCQDQENWRLQMNMYQPRSVYNYTATGFAKQRVPPALFQQILTFWEMNHDQQVEEWPERVSTYHNSWTVPTSIVRVENDTLPGGGHKFASHISNSLRPLLEEWTGMKLASTSTYGIRVYSTGAILAPHVDRMPLVTSAIINVAQDVNEPWPLEIYDHDGIAHNVTMQPGDMILYESHSAIHGRPFPLNGSYFANIFVHFEPVAPLQSVGASQIDRTYPPYLIRDSSWEYEWKKDHPLGWELFRHPWELAERGDVATLRLVAELDVDLLSRPNPQNDWEPLLYATLRGHFDVVTFLVDEGGVNVNAYYPNDPHFQSALHASNLKWGKYSPMSLYLRSQGAVVDPRVTISRYNTTADATDMYEL